MIYKIRRIIFYFFNKLIPIHWIEEAIKREKIKLNSLQCELGENVIMLPEARIINLQNNPSHIKIGNNSLIRGELQINSYGGKISIGENSSVGEYSRIWSSEKVVIGNNVHISHGVNIIDCNTHSLDPHERHNEYQEIISKGMIMNKGNIATAPIYIEDFVWISFNASILKGVKIGKGAIVAANSLVTKDVEPFTMVGGIPAMKIKSIEQI